MLYAFKFVTAIGETGVDTEVSYSAAAAIVFARARDTI